VHHYHHETATVEEVHGWHLNAGKIGIGYAVIINMDGQIWMGRGLDMAGAHTVNHNNRSVGVAFQGRYDDRTRVMPDAQFNAGVWMLKYLQKRYGTHPIYGHGELRATACPGRFFPLDEMRTLQYRGNFNERELTLTQFEELTGQILDLTDRVQTLEQSVSPIFSRLSEMPEWAHDAHVDAVERDIINGETIIANDTEEIIFLTPLSAVEMRQTVMNYRREQNQRQEKNKCHT